MDSLFGHLALRFQSHPENIATEALSYILSRSKTAKNAFLELISGENFCFESNLSFSTQVSSNDQSRPDIVGQNEYGEKPIIVESKFWAGLTENQPLSYFDQLPASKEGLLLFVAPAKRFNTLWPELLERCNKRYQIAETTKNHSEYWSTEVTDGKYMGLLSWRHLMRCLQLELKNHGEMNQLSDASQLLGLTERMDDLAFMPIRSEELSPEQARRYCDFASLVDDIASKTEQLGYCSMKGLRPTGGPGFYGRYLKCGNTGVYLSFDARKWSHINNTPLWLSIHGVEWKDKELSRRALSGYQASNPAKAIVLDDEFLIPLRLPIGEEKDEVVKDVARQIKGVWELLKDIELNANNTP